MKVSNKGIDLLIKEEGSIPYEYYCPAKVPTIGVGCVTKHLSENDISSFDRVPTEKVKQIGNIKKVVDKNGLVMIATEKQITDLLSKRLIDFENAVNDNVTIELEQYQFDALVSFCFNVGPRNLKISSLLKAVNNKADVDKIRTCFLKFNKIRVDGKLVKHNGLHARRIREAKLFNECVY